MLANLQHQGERLLRWSERYTKTDMVYVFRNSGWLAAGQIGVSLSALLLSIAFAHLVPKDVYGTYRYLLSILWVLTAFCFSGLPTAVVQAVARGYEGAYLRAFRMSIVWSLPMALIAFGTSAYYYSQTNFQLAYGLLIIGILGPFLQPALLFGTLLEGKRDFKRYAYFGIILNIAPVALTFASMFISKDPLVYLAAYLLGNVSTGFLLDYFAYRVHKPNTEVNPELAHLGFHFSAMNVLGTIAQQIDKLLIFHYLGATQLAVYSFATALPEQVKGLFNNLATLAFPKFSQATFSDIKKNFWTRMGLYTILLVVATIFYVVIAPIVFRLFFPAYTDAIFYSQLFALSLIVISNTIPLTLLQAQAANRELYIFNILSPLVQIATLVAFTIWYGLMGAIVARIITRVFNLLLLCILVEFYKPAPVVKE